MVLRPLDADRTVLVVRGEYALDDVDVGRHPELLLPGLPARFQLHGRSRDEERRVHSGGESPSDVTSAPDRDPFGSAGFSA